MSIFAIATAGFEATGGTEEEEVLAFVVEEGAVGDATTAAGFT